MSKTRFRGRVIKSVHRPGMWYWQVTDAQIDNPFNCVVSCGYEESQYFALIEACTRLCTIAGNPGMFG